MDFWQIIAWSVVIVIGIFFGCIAFIGAPYVPTHKKNVTKIFSELYPVSKNDLVLDIGSGDGVVLREVARLGGRAVGYELNIFLVLLSRLLSKKYGDRVSVKTRDFWRTDFPAQTTAVYTFGDDRDILRMYKKVQTQAALLRKDLYFISYAFEVPGIPHKKSQANAFLYKVSPEIA